MSNSGIPFVSRLCGLSDGRLFSSEAEALDCANNYYSYRGTYAAAVAIGCVIICFILLAALNLSASNYKPAALAAAAALGLALGWSWSSTSAYGPVSQFKSDEVAVASTVSKYNIAPDKARLLLQEERAAQQLLINRQSRSGAWGPNNVGFGGIRIGF